MHYPLPRVRFGADYSASNPYQALLYRAAGPTVEARPASPSEALAEADASDRPLIYHLHWEEHDIKFGTEAGRREAMQRLLDALDDLRGRGDHVVWTRHNLRPHDPAIRELNAEMLPHLDALASVIHLHSWEAAETVRGAGPLDLSKTVVIGHGSHIAHYPEWSGSAARRRLGVSPEAHVFLLFGRQDGYKQADRAAAALGATDDPDARLLIVGAGREDLASRLPADPRITLRQEHVPEAEVGLYHAAADTALLPYASSLTSGSAMLAASLGCGVLGPDVPGLRDVVRHGWSGALYDPDDPDALSKALAVALREGRETWAARGRRARETAECRDWAVPGRQWRDLFHGLAARPRRGGVTLARIALV